MYIYTHSLSLRHMQHQHSTVSTNTLSHTHMQHHHRPASTHTPSYTHMQHQHRPAKPCGKEPDVGEHTFSILVPHKGVCPWEPPPAENSADGWKLMCV